MKHSIVSIEITADEPFVMSFDEVCLHHGISDVDLERWIEQGLFLSDSSHQNPTTFNPLMVQRLQSACRLQADLGVNEPGVVLVLELFDELQQLRDELKVLTRHRDA